MASETTNITPAATETATAAKEIPSAAGARYILVFHAPPEAVQACKAAIFQGGAGRYPGSGNYTECAWSTMGTGQFRPGDAANPHIGKVGKLEKTPEVRVETLCSSAEVAKLAVEALKKAHPYEEPAYHVIKLEDF
ncbi:GTP cyclohydrolase 1 type 2/Nif3 [Podospora didyma]|uniref:ATP phosphoribosyltransferase n=1 Tax=Podospora didyma TaxID=330526 RepID=A0AAE0K9L6_9PEZI|nr:GTP cyclohydrolase 1 type 2/Nif3 [Podospora didyma]